MAKTLERVFALLALLNILMVQPASGQSFPTPPDVAAAQGSTFTEVAPLYPPSGAANAPDNTTPPAYSYELTDIPTPDLTNRVSTGANATDHSGYCLVYTNGYGGTDPLCTEAKFRTHINCGWKVNAKAYTLLLNDDPVRNYGQPGQSHTHQFCSNVTVNAYATYAKLRNEAYTLAAGDTVNSTGYWIPAACKTNPFADGNDYCVIPNYATVYYVEDPVDSPKLKHLIRGQRYVTGTEMDDPDDSLVKREIYNANQQTGTAGRYSYGSNGFAGWICDAGSGQITVTGGGIYAKALKNADGSDPWAGQCTAGAQLSMGFGAPNCWDRIHMWSPGGYKHFRHRIFSGGVPTCPNNYSMVPTLQIQFNYTTTGGWTDYQNWSLTSDAAMQSKLDTLPLCNLPSYSNAPCAETRRTVRPGESGHADWMGAWDGATFAEWQCNGPGVDGCTPHQMNDSVTGPNHKLNVSGAGPSGRFPQVDFNLKFGTATANDMARRPTGSMVGPKTMQMH